MLNSVSAKPGLAHSVPINAARSSTEQGIRDE